MAAPLSLFGAGRLGTTLARLWQDQHTFDTQQLLTQHKHTAQVACSFIGIRNDSACWKTDQLISAPNWLLACPDSQLADAVDTLVKHQLVTANGVVFHCSGAISSELLTPLREIGAACASIHPAHSFASPNKSIHQFSGSHCATEGDQRALDFLLPAFKAIGAQPFNVPPEQKLLYHAGSVMACNYMVSLIQASLDTFALANVEPQQAKALLAPLLQGTLDNILKQDSAAALTGPIARGDVSLVTEQLSELQQQNTELAEIYRVMGQNSIAIAADSGLSLDKQQQFKHLFEKPPL